MVNNNFGLFLLFIYFFNFLTNVTKYFLVCSSHVPHALVYYWKEFLKSDPKMLVIQTRDHINIMRL